MSGGAGDDVLMDILLTGGADPDRLEGGAGNDTISGGDGGGDTRPAALRGPGTRSTHNDDTMSAGTGDDVLMDTLTGGADPDRPEGGAGNDTMCPVALATTS